MPAGVSEGSYRRTLRRGEPYLLHEYQVYQRKRRVCRRRCTGQGESHFLQGRGRIALQAYRLSRRNLRQASLSGRRFVHDSTYGFYIDTASDIYIEDSRIMWGDTKPDKAADGVMQKNAHNVVIE